MHLFYDSTLNTWRLITEKLPEKPEEPRSETEPWLYKSEKHHDDWNDYKRRIAALKQNALTVGNPEICPQNMSAVEPGKLYEWPGGYEKKEIQEPTISEYDINSGRVPMGSTISKGKTVAILTLPEEKKNTMENMTKEQAVFDYSGWSRDALIYHIMTLENKLASGSVAAPKEEETYPQPGKRCVKEGELMTPCHVIEGADALDYAGKCFGCGSKRAITFDEENQTEADAAREYLIKEGLDPDELVKEGLAVINGIHEKIRLEKELAAAKESIKALYRISQQKLYETEVNTVEFSNIKSVLDHAQKVLG